MRPLYGKKAVEEKAARDALHARERDEDLRAVLSTVEGRRLLLRFIEEEAGVTADAFTGDAEGTIYREGRRSVGITALRDALRVAPELCLEGIQELFATWRTEKAIQAQADIDAAKEHADADE